MQAQQTRGRHLTTMPPRSHVVLFEFVAESIHGNIVSEHGGVAV